MMLSDDRAATAPLDEFRAAYEADDNVWWASSCGHHQNVFEDACDEIDRLRADLDRLREENETAQRTIDALTKAADRDARQMRELRSLAESRAFANEAIVEVTVNLSNDLAAARAELAAIDRELAEWDVAREPNGGQSLMTPQAGAALIRGARALAGPVAEEKP